MILPTKHLRPERSLVVVGAEVLEFLESPQTISSLWYRIRDKESHTDSKAPVSYGWFVLALDFLFLIGAIDLDKGMIARNLP